MGGGGGGDYEDYYFQYNNAPLPPPHLGAGNSKFVHYNICQNYAKMWEHPCKLLGEIFPVKFLVLSPWQSSGQDPRLIDHSHEYLSRHL